MAILKSIYNEKTLTEKVWYESSSVVYSEFIEHENDNNGELFVTFKNGSTYHYKNVDMVLKIHIYPYQTYEGLQAQLLF